MKKANVNYRTCIKTVVCKVYVRCGMVINVQIQNIVLYFRVFGDFYF